MGFIAPGSKESQKVLGTLLHHVFPVFSDASKVPDTFFNAISCTWT
jgi:hypothetical protein